LCEKARVFISCGQRRETEELEIAEKIANDLKGLGFDPYVALQEQKLEGVKENIFRKLSNSEYFLFIDFKREKLADSDVCRGSLFSHQELAIATFLGHEVLAFQEEGVKKDDGVLRFIQANCIPFAKRTDLPATVLAKIKEKGWEATWRNELFLKPKMRTNTKKR
jgi:hypothetical protein